MQKHGLESAFKEFGKSLGADQLLIQFDFVLELRKKFTQVNWGQYVKESWNGAIGQLSVKEEAAGKLRVFAMVDIWTQSICKPLHLALFSILKRLPNDATHDQEAAVKRCFAKADEYGLSFGYDLSAATDRLPISLQVEVLSV